MGIRTKWDAQTLAISAIQDFLPFNGVTDRQFQKPNGPFQTPRDGEWIRATMNDLLVEDQDATGCFRFVSGLFTVDVFSPKESGDFKAHDLAEKIRKTLSNSYYDTLKIQQGLISIVPDDTWYRLAIEFNYTYEGLTDGS